MATLRFIRSIIRNQLISPVQEFIKDSRAVGIVLLACTILSLILANSAWALSYQQLLEKEFHFPEGLLLPHSITHWINDGLMAVFFFLVGMEIKRELLIGELSSFKKASLPVAAALGGMLLPALIFIAFNRNTNTINGWGIPMATDIAFSLGVASLLGSRVPVSLKIFLMALAIIDDLGAILVIAIFYGGAINWLYLAGAAILAVVVFALTKLKLHQGWLILAGGLALWYCIFNSGIHATIAGVIAAFLVPLDLLHVYEHRLHSMVNFLILPLFALANTAIVLPNDFMHSMTTPLSWGVLVGLVLGKPMGILLFSGITIFLKLGEKPADSSWLQLAGIGALAGIGFTMSIFITMLAFQDSNHQNTSKLAILIGALISIFAGLLLFSRGGTLNKLQKVE